MPSTGKSFSGGRASTAAEGGSVRVSVALCTYNGERFLGELLESILAQTQLPDELVARDDGSRDGTRAVLEAFAAKAPFPVRVIVNERNLGSTRNFEAAARDCAGDIIVLSDQDDVWLPRKLETLLAPMARDDPPGVVFSNADVVDERLEPLGYTLWDSIGFGADDQAAFQKDPFSVLLRHNVVTGTTAAFRADLRDRVFPVDATWVHDAWIAFMAALVDEVEPVPQVTTLYRQHASNQIGGLKPTRMAEAQVRARRAALNQRATFERDLAFWSVALRHAERLDVRPERRPALAHLAERVEHLRARAALPRRRLARLGPVASEWRTGRYRRHSAGAVSAIKDVLLR